MTEPSGKRVLALVFIFVYREEVSPPFHFFPFFYFSRWPSCLSSSLFTPYHQRAVCKKSLPNGPYGYMLPRGEAGRLGIAERWVFTGRAAKYGFTVCALQLRSLASRHFSFLVLFETLQKLRNGTCTVSSNVTKIVFEDFACWGFPCRWQNSRIWTFCYQANSSSLPLVSFVPWKIQKIFSNSLKIISVKQHKTIGQKLEKTRTF